MRALAVVMLAWGVACLLADDHKQFYSTILGGRVDLIHDVQTLSRAVQATERFLAEHGVATGQTHFCCASYLSASALAQSERIAASEGIPRNSSITPLLVDAEEDRMCFLAATAPGRSLDSEVGGGLDCRPCLPTLKIHDHLYAALEGDEDELGGAWDLSVHFQPALLPSDPLTSFSSWLVGRSHSDLFEDFFWVANELPQRSLRANQTATRDALRTLKWSALASTGPSSCYEELLAGAVLGEQSMRLSLPTLRSAADRAFLAGLTARLANQPAVTFLSLDGRPQGHNYRARSIAQTATSSSSLSAQPFTAAGLRGDGQVVAITDTGLDMMSCYFRDPNGHPTPAPLSSSSASSNYRKVVKYSYYGPQRGDGVHGTHTSGTAVGSIANEDISSGNARFDGVAPNAKLVFTDIGSSFFVPPLDLLYDNGRAAGARVFGNSYGTSFTGSAFYANQAMDNYLFNHQDTAVFYSAGNLGAARSVSRESSGKNVVAVGGSESSLGSDNIAEVAFFSSQGPAYDGRIKPDLVAPGLYLLSAKASGGLSSQSCDTLQMAGTSVACPAAAGSALLVRQYFMDSRFWAKVCRSGYRLCHPFSPSGVLVKAILIHGGASMAAYDPGRGSKVKLQAGPDAYQGFGRLSLYKALPVPGRNNQAMDLFVDDQATIQENDQKTYRLAVSSSTTQLRATLVWYDPPGVQGTTSKALIHDLDLSVSSPSGRTYYPNGLSGKDKLNTVERVVVTNPSSGSWTLTVRAGSLPLNGRQSFALVITSSGSVSD
eukprot:gene8456-9322_t